MTSVSNLTTSEIPDQIEVMLVQYDTEGNQIGAKPAK